LKPQPFIRQSVEGTVTLGTHHRQQVWYWGTIETTQGGQLN
jgi:hypothetical protein